MHVFEAIPIRAESSEVSGTRKSSAVLKCTTENVGGYPLSVCRFLSPNGKFYYIKDDNSTAR